MRRYVNIERGRRFRMPRGCSSRTCGRRLLDISPNLLIVERHEKSNRQSQIKRILRVIRYLVSAGYRLSRRLHIGVMYLLQCRHLFTIYLGVGP